MLSICTSCINTTDTSCNLPPPLQIKTPSKEKIIGYRNFYSSSNVGSPNELRKDSHPDNSNLLYSLNKKIYPSGNTNYRVNSDVDILIENMKHYSNKDNDDDELFKHLVKIKHQNSYEDFLCNMNSEFVKNNSSAVYSEELNRSMSGKVSKNAY